MESIEAAKNSNLEMERKKFVEAGWKQTDYAHLFVEGNKAALDDFLGTLPNGTDIEGRFLTVARHKTHSDTFIDIIYIKEGNETPPLEASSGYEVYQVKDGVWERINKEPTSN